MKSNNMITDELLKSYKSTTYTTNPPNVFHIRIGKTNSSLNDYLLNHGYKNWAFITAENPCSQILSIEENILRNEKFEMELKKEGFAYVKGQGIPKSMNWAPEKSFLVFDVAMEKLRKMARSWQQNAFVYGSLATLPELICLDY